jgi:hypothetical protein
VIRDAVSHTGVTGFGDVVLSSRERPFPVEPMGSGLRGPRALVRRALCRSQLGARYDLVSGIFPR